ncbi:MAG TPA: FKBP-type peptidyl-prolyl cis-trans isomerase [Pseudomonadales bacterium]|nr:FKBP-type peptidyl-prolyl cis-trans isomerase [Pseudomonadales bacterium]
MPDQPRIALAPHGAPHFRIARTVGLLTLVGAASVLSACDPSAGGKDEAQAAVAPESASGRISYGAGYAMAENFSEQLGEDFDGAAFASGVDDAVAQRDRLVDDEALTAARDEIVARRQAQMEQEAESSLEAARTFLAANAEREGITVTESGIQYEVLKSGDGASPEVTDTVVTHYTGSLPDGTVFDSSEERGEPATFGLDRVIPGWTEALQLMKVGDRWRIWLPPELAYGERGAGDDIPPNSALVFEVELLDVNPEG